MRRFALLSIVALGLVSLAAACGGGDEVAPATEPPVAESQPTTTTQTTTTTAPPETGTSEAQPTDENETPAILVETPAPGDTVSSPLKIAGTANVFEATVSYSLEDANGTEIAKGFTTATCGTGCRGTFDVTVPFDGAGASSGTLYVFEVSAEDGSRTKVVEIPLTFAG